MARPRGRTGNTLKCPSAGVVTSVPRIGVKYRRTPAARAAVSKSTRVLCSDETGSSMPSPASVSMRSARVASPWRANSPVCTCVSIAAQPLVSTSRRMSRRRDATAPFAADPPRRGRRRTRSRGRRRSRSGPRAAAAARCPCRCRPRPASRRASRPSRCRATPARRCSSATVMRLGTASPARLLEHRDVHGGFGHHLGPGPIDHGHVADQHVVRRRRRGRRFAARCGRPAACRAGSPGS